MLTFTCIMLNLDGYFTVECRTGNALMAAAAVMSEGQQPAYNSPSVCVAVIEGKPEVMIPGE